MPELMYMGKYQDFGILLDMSGNGKPEVTDKYVTSYDGVAFVYIFLDTLYFWVEDRACI
jgi:hypothetical protein